MCGSWGVSDVGAQGDMLKQGEMALKWDGQPF